MTKCIIHSNIKICEGGDTVVEKTIKEIRETEQEAEKIMVRAKNQGAQLLEQTKQETEDAKAAMIAKAQEKAQEAREAAQVAGEKKLEEALKSAAKEIAEIRNTAKKKEEETVNVIISRLV